MQLKTRMRAGETVSSISLTSFHAVADMVTAKGGGRTLSIKDMPDGDVHVDDDGGSGGPVDGGLGARIDVDAPARLLAAALRGVGPEARPMILEISATSMEDPGSRSGGLEWKIAVGSDADRDTCIGDLHGRHVYRRAGDVPAPPEGQEGPALAASGVNAVSLVRTGNLERAIAAVAARPDARGGVEYVRVQPKEVLIVYVEPVGIPDAEGRVAVRERYFTVDAAGGISTFQRPDRRRRTDAVGVPSAALDGAAPDRALRAIARRGDDDAPDEVRTAEFRMPTSQDGGGRPGWHLEVKDGGRLSLWATRADGSGLRTDPFGG